MHPLSKATKDESPNALCLCSCVFTHITGQSGERIITDMEHSEQNDVMTSLRMCMTRDKETWLANFCEYKRRMTSKPKYLNIFFLD